MKIGIVVISLLLCCGCENIPHPNDMTHGKEMTESEAKRIGNEKLKQYLPHSYYKYKVVGINLLDQLPGNGPKCWAIVYMGPYVSSFVSIYINSINGADVDVVPNGTPIPDK
jgi:hypothetical protein